MKIALILNHIKMFYIQKSKVELFLHPRMKMSLSFPVPLTVTSLREYSFMDCSLLKTVILPPSVKEIGWDVFRNCTRLAYMLIPASVTAIGDYAFAECTSLSSVIFHGEITSISPHLFDRCSKLMNFIIPMGVKSIGEYAFFKYTSLLKFQFHRHVTFIDQFAFFTLYEFNLYCGPCECDYCESVCL